MHPRSGIYYPKEYKIISRLVESFKVRTVVRPKQRKSFYSRDQLSNKTGEHNPPQWKWVWFIFPASATTQRAQTTLGKSPRLQPWALLSKGQVSRAWTSGLATLELTATVPYWLCDIGQVNIYRTMLKMFLAQLWKLHDTAYDCLKARVQTYNCVHQGYLHPGVIMFTKLRLPHQRRLMIGRHLKIPVNNLQWSTDSNLLLLPSQVLEKTSPPASERQPCPHTWQLPYGLWEKLWQSSLIPPPSDIISSPRGEATMMLIRLKLLGPLTIMAHSNAS